MKKKTKEPVLCHVNSNFKCKQRLKALFTSNIRKEHLISSYDWSISSAVIRWYLPTMANIKKIISKTNVIFNCTCTARWISHSIFFFKFLIGLNKKMVLNSLLDKLKIGFKNPYWTKWRSVFKFYIGLKEIGFKMLYWIK